MPCRRVSSPSDGVVVSSKAYRFSDKTIFIFLNLPLTLLGADPTCINRGKNPADPGVKFSPIPGKYLSHAPGSIVYTTLTVRV
jgi:hypothetical protein